jgi:hypothetical protein
MSTLTVDTFTKCLDEPEIRVPRVGYAIQGDALYRDGRRLGWWRSITDLAEPVFVGWSGAQRAVRGPRGPYEIVYEALRHEG